jgi:hypothetical protein
MKKEKNDSVKNSVNAIINGKCETIIPAYTIYNMAQPKDKKGLIGKADKSKMLDVMYHFAKPEIFWTEEFELKDINGNIIPKGTANAYVVCDTAESYWRIFTDEELKNVQIHEFESVKEFAQTIGNTMLCSRSLNNVEKIGVAALATGNEAYMTTFTFAKKNSLTMNTARLYLGIKMIPIETSLMTIGNIPEKVPTLGRTEEDAQEIFEQALTTFGANAKKRYVPRVVNTLLRKEDYDKEVLIGALKLIPSSEIALIQLAACEEREDCICSTLTKWIEEVRKTINNKKAA